MSFKSNAGLEPADMATWASLADPAALRNCVDIAV
jgi:hypothetical protein